MSSTTSKQLTLAAFRRRVWRYYEASGRHMLPWRATRDPYRILVSEVMLQQTQVTRVIPKYRTFLKAFPTVRALATATLAEVLIEWQGLGYNRRAKYLHETAKIVAAKQGKFPRLYAELRTLPGIGTYTAGAISAFCYNEPIPIIETNIRTVFLHHFFPGATNVPDAMVMQLITATLPRTRAREWYYALMDYGAYLKQRHPNPSRQSKHHVIQPRFDGSDRQLRGALLRILTTRSTTLNNLTTQLTGFTSDRIKTQLEKLRAEGLVSKSRARYTLPT